VTVQARTRQTPVRFWNRSRLGVVPTLSVIVCCGLGILLIWAGTTSAGSGNPEGWLAIASGAVVVALTLSFIRHTLSPVLVVTAHTLRRHRFLSRTQIIPLDQVTGIGLVYKRVAGAPTPEGWLLYVWTTGDIPSFAGISYSARWLRPASKVREKFLAFDPSPAELARSVDPYHFSYHFNPVLQTDPLKIAATRAARAARDVYDLVLAYQGPSGYLAVRQDQKHVPIPGFEPASRGTPNPLPLERCAFWSPDGELGYPKVEPPPAASISSGEPRPQPKQPGLLRQLQYRVRLIGRKFQRRRGDIFDDVVR
jgi:hypothetical protein